MAAVAGTSGSGQSEGSSGVSGSSSTAAPAPAPAAAPAPAPKPKSVASSGKDRRVATLRLVSDMKRLQEDAPPGVSASPMSEDNLFIWNASIMGPEESPWEGGIFSLRLTFPDQYPNKAPKVRFTCEMFHPNVYPDGSICLDIIQNLWKPIYTVDMLLTSIQSLLTDPNCDSPANVDAARLYVNDRKQYKRRVRRTAAKTIEE